MPKILKHIITKNSLILKTDKGNIKLQCCGNNIVRVVYTLRENFLEKESLMVINPIIEDACWSFEDYPDVITMYLQNMYITIDKRTAAFYYYDKNGKLLTKEPESGGKFLKSVNVMKKVYDGTVEIKTEHNADGVRARVENEKEILDRIAYETKLHFCFNDEEALYGLGSYEEGIMNLRGHHQYLYQQNLKSVMPLLVSTNGYGILVDSYSNMTFRDDIYGSYIWTEVSDEMDYYFIYGPEIDSVIKGYRSLTGKVPMLPKWAFGYIQSKERYKTQQELIDVVSEYRKKKIPLDCIVLDWQSWPGDLWGQKSFDTERFPTPEVMMEELHQLNAKLMVSIWPIMSNNGPNQLEMKERGFLLGNEANYDAFNPAARELYWKQANEGIFSKGTDAWWCDCTEPFEADWNGEIKPEPEQRVKINTDEAKKYLDPGYINAFSLLHSKGLYEGQRGTTSEKRVVNLTRSSFAGQQRYSTITWSGDISANWQTLKNQIPGGLNFCAAGSPYWTLDIGAFFVDKKRQWFWDGEYANGCKDEGYRELYTRWFQYGCFLPMFRSHGTDTPREVWQFGEPGSLFYDTLVKFVNLRYRLLPYIYSIACQITNDDYTLMRALPFDFRHDKKTYNISDQYMFGTAFMVCPVTNPMYYESNSKELINIDKSRDVYLPEGYCWYNFWTGEQLQGGRSIVVDAPIDIMPLFIKSGSIIPMGPFVQHSEESNDSELELRIYPGSDAKFLLYGDEGDSYNYEKGCCSTIEIVWIDNEQKLIIGNRNGSFENMPEKITFKVVLVSDNNGNGTNYANNYNKIIEYSGSKVTEII
jgi:alpha-D-xyloside xylohydrolase